MYSQVHFGVLRWTMVQSGLGQSEAWDMRMKRAAVSISPAPLRLTDALPQASASLFTLNVILFFWIDIPTKTQTKS